MFLPHVNDRGTHQPWEYIPAAAGTYSVGQLLGVSGGKLVALSTATKTTPPYLCQAKITVADGEAVPVTRVTDDVIYETTLSAEAASAAIGAKLEVSAGGLQADAAASGTFEVVYIEGTAADSVVRGRFL